MRSRFASDFATALFRRSGTSEGFSEREMSDVLSVRGNAAALFLTLVANAGFGYLSWLVAARLVSADVVGLAAAIVSATLLCSNFTILGLGISVVTFLPGERRNPTELLNAFLTIVVLASCAGGVLFVLVSVGFLDQLHILGSHLLLAACFVGLTTATGTLLLLDGESVAVRRADFAVVRAVVAGVSKLLIIVVAWVVSSLSATIIVLAWLLSTLCACALGQRQIRRTFPAYRYRPQVSWRWTRIAIANGLPNHALTLSRLAPSLVIPIVVTEVLSPSTNAYWYAAWMVAFLARFIPVATGQAVFADLSNEATSFTTRTWRSLWSSFAISLLPVAGVIILAEPILSLMGPGYAGAGATPLRLLALAVFPQSFIEFYLVAQRVARRFVEPNVVLGMGAVLSIAAAAYGADVRGLVGVAVGWLSVETLVGIWAAAQLALLFRDRDEPGPA